MENKSFIAKYAKLLVILAVFCGSASGPIATIISCPPLMIGFGRLTIALPFFAIPVFRNPEKRRMLKEMDKEQFFTTMATGIFLFLHFFCWFSAVKHTNVSAAAVLASFHPIVVLLLTIFVYKKKVPGKAIIAIIIALAAGAYLMCSDFSAFSDGNLMGKLLALGAGIFMGIYFAVGGRVRPKMDGSVYVMLIFFWCWVCFTIACIVTGTPVLGYTAMDYIGIIALAFVCQIGSHAMFNLCMGHVDSLYVSAWESMDPVTSTILAVIIASQIPSITEVICCVIVVAALLAYTRYSAEGENNV
ncbi:MAG: DMT family transporter [Clostridiales bacterium]|nr:DMT family transporter [Clostridiales bacterium]